MWKPTGDRVLTVLIDSKPQYSRNYSRKIQETRRELTGEAQAEREAAKAHDEQVFDSIGNSSSGGILGTIGSAISKFIPNAKGGVYESPSLSTYSNGIYDSPQFFAFAKGAGVFGEAGPEAIMPLTRTSDGSLGVRAINSKSGNGGGDITYAPVYQITIQNDGQNGEIGPQAIKTLMGMVDQRVQGTLLNMRRDGGMLSG